MKKKIIIIFLIILSFIIYRSLFCYRIIAITNSGNLKYKDNGEIIYFPRPPLSIINPLKKEILITEVVNFCNSPEFKLNQEDYDCYQQLIANNNIAIESIKDVKDDNIYILIQETNYLESMNVFVFNKKLKKVIRYF